MKSQALKEVTHDRQFRSVIGRFWWVLLILFSGLGFTPVASAETFNLTVKLIDSTANAVLANKKVVAYERAVDGKLSWRMTQTTDALGLAYFDLIGLGEGKIYVLKASPYEVAWVPSIKIQNPGTFEFRVGRLDLTAINGATGSRLKNTKIVAYERFSDGSRRWVTQIYYQ